MDNIFSPRKQYYTSWKDKTFTQITSIIQLNKSTTANHLLEKNNLFLAQPIKHYRKEIYDLSANCHSKFIEQNIIDVKTLSKYREPQHNINDICRSIDLVRSSSGIIKHTVNSDGIVKTKYCTSAKGIMDRKIKSAKTPCYIPFVPGTTYPSEQSFQPQEYNRPFTENSKGHQNSGAYTTRKVFNTLTNEGFTMRTSSGSMMPNIISYNIPKGGYIKKEFSNVIISDGIWRDCVLKIVHMIL